ncbi:MAG: bifunctional ornithine acetyltransferase/N-acetylglutamate synthase, partial [Lachnospiraceae bacterium]|nr:bifunctional ornithine acetyltransferase/N-acetylglutamate synthase [Lachnospiraceae bacterium]
MIAPNMGTMLSFIVTDAVVPADEIKKALRASAN